MFKLILINSFNLILLISYCHTMPQSDQISSMGNHNHQFHQPNHFSTQLHSRSPSQKDIHRSSRLLPSASSPQSSIINTRTNQEIRPQFNQNQNNFKPIINRSPQLRAPQSNNQKRLKQQHKNHQHLQSKISWGRCPMLQPSLEEKMKKAQVISKCLEITPVPENITRETIELHRELVAACALKEEGWFTTTSSLTSDDDIKLININKTINDSLNATATIEELIKNGTLKTNPLDNNSTITSETNSSPVYLHSLNDTTKMDNSDNKLTTLTANNTLTTLAKNDTQFNNQTFTIETKQKHSALESDEYSEDDYSSIFTGALTYNYSKAEHEIRSKKFDKDVEEKVIEFHENCKEEAQDKYNNPIQIIAQIQLYQACMDYHISNICGIEVIY